MRATMVVMATAAVMKVLATVAVAYSNGGDGHSSGDEGAFCSGGGLQQQTVVTEVLATVLVAYSNRWW